MATSTKQFYCLLVTITFLCLVHFSQGLRHDKSSSSDLFLEEEGSGSGVRLDDDSETSSSGKGEDDEDSERVKIPPKPTSRPDDSYRIGIGGNETSNHSVMKDSIPIGLGSVNFNQTKKSHASCFSQPGMLPVIVCGVIVSCVSCVPFFC